MKIIIVFIITIGFMSNINSQNYKIPDDSLRNQIEKGIVDSIVIYGRSFWINPNRALDESDLLKSPQLCNIRKEEAKIFFEKIKNVLLTVVIVYPSSTSYFGIDLRILGVIYMRNYNPILIGFGDYILMTINYRVYTVNYRLFRLFYEKIHDKKTKKSIKKRMKSLQDKYCW